VSRVEIASGGRRRTRMWHQFRACCFGLGQTVCADSDTRLGVSRLLATSTRHLGTSAPRRGFRGILGLGLAVSSRFAVRLLFRGVIDFSSLLTELTPDAVSTFSLNLARTLLRRERLLWSRLALFQVITVALVCRQFVN